MRGTQVGMFTYKRVILRLASTESLSYNSCEYSTAQRSDTWNPCITPVAVALVRDWQDCESNTRSEVTSHVHSVTGAAAEGQADSPDEHCYEVRTKASWQRAVRSSEDHQDAEHQEESADELGDEAVYCTASSGTGGEDTNLAASSLAPVAEEAEVNDDGTADTTSQLSYSSSCELCASVNAKISLSQGYGRVDVSLRCTQSYGSVNTEEYCECPACSCADPASTLCIGLLQVQVCVNANTENHQNQGAHELA